MDDLQSNAETNINEVDIADFATLRNKNYTANTKLNSSTKPNITPTRFAPVNLESQSTPPPPSENATNILPNILDDESKRFNDYTNDQENLNSNSIPPPSSFTEPYDTESPRNYRPRLPSSREEQITTFTDSIDARSKQEIAMESEAKVNMCLDLKSWGVKHDFKPDSKFEPLHQFYTIEKKLHERNMHLMLCREIVGLGAGVVAFGYNIADKKLSFMQTGVNATEWQEEFVKGLHETKALDNDLQSLSQTLERSLPGPTGAILRIAFYMGTSLQQHVRSVIDANNSAIKMLKKTNDEALRKHEEKLNKNMEDMLASFLGKMKNAQTNPDEPKVNNDPNPSDTFANAQQANECFDEQFNSSCDSEETASVSGSSERSNALNNSG